MPDLNLDVNFRDHPKTRRFVAMMGKDSEWLVVKLWLHVARVLPEGKLKGWTPHEIEGIAEWGGTPGAFIEAMERLDWLKKDSFGNYVLSGWKEHQGHLIAFKERGKIAAKTRWAKKKQDMLQAMLKEKQALLKSDSSNALTDGANGTNVDDAEWRKMLQASEAYKHVNVESEFQKSVFWCEQRKRKPTRKFFLNWINKIEAPMSQTKPTQQGSLSEYQPHRRAA